MPRPVLVGRGFGDASIGMTAGRGIEGAGETDLLEEKDDLLLWLMTLGGFIGNMEVGVPGADGIGESAAMLDTASMDARTDR